MPGWLSQSWVWWRVQNYSYRWTVNIKAWLVSMTVCTDGRLGAEIGIGKWEGWKDSKLLIQVTIVNCQLNIQQKDHSKHDWCQWQCVQMCVSLSLVVEESDATVVTASDEGWGSGRVGETTDGGQVTSTQGNKRAHVHILHSCQWLMVPWLGMC